MKLNFLVFFCALISVSIAQPDATWYFGNNAGLSFTTSPPTVLTNGMINNPDNVSTISDANGNLLFYSDGSTVWNKNHLVMSNGTGLIGNWTAGQCALIVPIPCSNSRYAIFSPTEFSSPGNLHYSVVDMNQSGGLGAVEVATKNTSLGSGWTEKLCAYYYAPGNYYWVLTHKWNSADFVAFKVSATGIATQSVVSTVGSIHSCGQYSGAHDAMGQLTISPDGLKVANALTCQDGYELFDFNPNTGQLSNPISLPSEGGYAWGTAFSPDSRKLYTNRIFGTTIVQFDISLPTASAIQASSLSVGTSSTGGYSFGYMELAPDNKIYIARPNTNALASIASPNSLGTACNFSLSGINLGSVNSSWGLSRCAFNISAMTASLNYSLSSTSYCAGQTLTVTMLNSGTYFWNNLLGSSTYTVLVNSPQTLTVAPSSGCQTLLIPLVPLPNPVLNYTVLPPTYCVGQTVTVSVSGQGPYLWNNTLGSNTYTTLVSGATNVSLAAANGCGGTVIALSPGTSSISYNVVPSVFCAGQNVTITVSGAGPFTWNNAPGGNQKIYSVINTLTINVYESESCRSSAISLAPQACVGLENLSSTLENFGVYPNPCSNFLRLSISPTSDVIIRDLAGRNLKTVSPQMLKKNQEMDVSDLNSGLYLISCGDRHHYFLKE